ncbi:MAG: glycosyltransferase family 9 protein [Bacteroidia bacterium]|nr:glycosyltransferase family 9 protein [Bacteroidia bacterium]MDW8015365.1 glycosyltransferase family 9 protein [Bacteroidia bacterium]
MRKGVLPRLLRQLEWRSRVVLRSGVVVLEGMGWLPPPSPSPGKGEGFSLIRLDGIGDFWLWLPFVAALKKAYSDSPFYLVANPLWKELAEQTGFFQTIVSVDPSRLRRSFQYRRAIRRMLATLFPSSRMLLQSTFSRRIAVEDWVAWTLPAAQRIAWQRDPLSGEPLLLSQWIDQALYNKVLETPTSFFIHEWRRYSAWLDDLGLGPLEWDIYSALRHRLAPSSPSSAYGIVVVGASVSYKVPPADVWIKLCTALRRYEGVRLYVVGTAAERGHAALLQSVAEDWTGRLSLREAVQKIIGASFVLSTDTGMGHIAATLGVPTIMIAGGGHWGRFIPYPAEVSFPLKVIAKEKPCFGCGWMCKYQYTRTKAYPCIREIASAGVVEEALSWLKEVRKAT